MRILGIGDHVSCGSALLEDGKLITAITDERLVREKMVFGIPRESIKKIMELNHLSPGDIDAIAVATQNQHLVPDYVDFKNGWFGLQRGKYKQTLFELASNVSKFRSAVPFMDDAYYMLRQSSFAKRRSELERIFQEEFGFTCPVHFMDHHYCHATSAYYTSGYDDATVVTIDGGGDAKSGRVYNVKNGDFEEMTSISSFDSLARFTPTLRRSAVSKPGVTKARLPAWPLMANRSTSPNCAASSNTVMATSRMSPMSSSSRPSKNCAGCCPTISATRFWPPASRFIPKKWSSIW